MFAANASSPLQSASRLPGPVVWRVSVRSVRPACHGCYADFMSRFSINPDG
jgi:hypothetical protein